MPRLFSVVESPHGGSMPLPNPRSLSVGLSQSIPVPHDTVNSLFTIFGQFISHDTTLSTLLLILRCDTYCPPDMSWMLFSAPSFQVNNRQPDCCVVNAECRIPECFQFSVPPLDPFYSQFNITCHQFARSLPSLQARCKTGKGL